MTIAENFSALRADIKKTCKAAGRPPDSVALIAVSKQQPPAHIDAALETGHRLFGENRVQDAVERWQDRKAVDPSIRLHLIGPLQSNKVKEAVALFDVIETVDRENVVLELARHQEKAPQALEFFIQVNTGDEDQKSGVSVQALPALLKLCRDKGLNVTGLMCIPPIADPPGLHFALLHKLARASCLEKLSMGMSADYPKAINAGATHIRVGTALFGEREK